MSDMKALADWIRAGAPFDPEHWGQHQDQLDAAADVLEAVQQEVVTLTAEADRAIDQANNLAGDLAVQQTPEQDARAARFLAMTTPLGYSAALSVVESMTSLIEHETRAKEAQQAPAVDREALIGVIRSMQQRGMSPNPPAEADQILASGILLDAAEVEARGLERLIERVTDQGLVQMFGGEKFVSVALLVSEARAQQVREGNA